MRAVAVFLARLEREGNRSCTIILFIIHNIPKLFIGCPLVVLSQSNHSVVMLCVPLFILCIPNYEFLRISCCLPCLLSY